MVHRGYGQAPAPDPTTIVGGAFPEIYCPQDVEAGRPMTASCKTYYAQNPAAPGAPSSTSPVVIWSLIGVGVLAALFLMGRL